MYEGLEKVICQGVLLIGACPKATSAQTRFATELQGSPTFDFTCIRPVRNQSVLWC